MVQPYGTHNKSAITNIFADECTRDTNPAIYDPTVLDGTEVPSCELSIDFGLTTAWTTTRAAIHYHPYKHAAAADSKVELTWA